MRRSPSVADAGFPLEGLKSGFLADAQVAVWHEPPVADQLNRYPKSSIFGTLSRRIKDPIMRENFPAYAE
jgi:hypothetical protein